MLFCQMVPRMCLRIFLLLVDVMFIGVLIIYLDFISFALFCLFSYSICFPYMGPLFASTAKLSLKDLSAINFTYLNQLEIFCFCFIS